MIIGLDISSIPYGTGVSNYTQNLVLNLLQSDTKNTYKLFYSSLRQNLPADFLQELKKYKNYKLYLYRFPPTILSILWNKLHILSIEHLIGQCDIFHCSDWTQPPTQVVVGQPAPQEPVESSKKFQPQNQPQFFSASSRKCVRRSPFLLRSISPVFQGLFWGGERGLVL